MCLVQLKELHFKDWNKVSVSVNRSMSVIQKTVLDSGHLICPFNKVDFVAYFQRNSQWQKIVHETENIFFLHNVGFLLWQFYFAIVKRFLA